MVTASCLKKGINIKFFYFMPNIVLFKKKKYISESS